MSKIIENKEFEGERPLFMLKDAKLINVKFNFGESPLKESENLELSNVTFTYKYPIWYSKHISVKNSTLEEMARSGIWYTEDIILEDVLLNCPKTFRHSNKITVVNSTFTDAKESFWFCSEISLKNVKANGDYMFMESKNISVENFELDGNYCFDGAKNISVRNSKLISKDSFWNCENVYVENSEIRGEYIGWNSKNVVFKNCIIESNQGFCYMKNVKLIDCVLENTELAFEYSTVDATINSRIESIKNPISGTIVCDEVGEVIIDENAKKPCRTQIFQRKREENV